jgi:hypothetical protein
VRFLSWGLRDLLDQKNIKFGMVIDPRARAVLNQHKTGKAVLSFVFSNKLRKSRRAARNEGGASAVESHLRVPMKAAL